MAWKWFWNTETEYYDEAITRATDWGGDASTGHIPVSGGRVQEWLKTEINGRFGFLNMRFNEAESMYYIECFTSEEDYILYNGDKEGYKTLLLQNIQIPISTVQGDTFTAQLRTSMSNTANIVVTEDKLEIPLNFRSIKITQIGNENAGYNGTLIVQTSTNGETWNTVGSIPNILTSQEPDDTSYIEKNKVDIGKYLTNGKQYVRVRAQYTYENEDGEEKAINSSNVIIGNSVTKTSLELELVTEYYRPIYAINAETGAYNNIAINYRVYGAVDKVLHVLMEGSLGTQTMSIDISSLSDGEIKGVSFNYNEAYGFHTHGVKKVKAWVEAKNGLKDENGEDIIITSNELANQFMVVADESNMQKYLLLQNIASSVDNYIQTQIAEYAVYSPDGSDTELSFQIQDTKGNVYTEMHGVAAPNTDNKFIATIEIEPTDEGNIPDNYNTRFYVFNGEENFISTSGLNRYGYYDLLVDNMDAIIPTLGATFLLDPKSRDNSESGRDKIYNAKANNQAVDAEFNNFGFINDGWITAEDGQKVLRVAAGSTLTIKRNIWKLSSSSNLTIEIDYRVSNVTNVDDPIVQIKGGSGNKGIILNALKGWVRTASYNSDDNCMFAWRENERQFLSVNINNNVKPLGNGCIYPASMATQANGTIALARVLLNGDPVREIPFDKTKSSEWWDDENASIVIGNSDADIDIYSIRIYENKALDWVDLLMKNYPSSMPTAEEKNKFIESNKIRTGRYISLEESLKKGLNCIVYHARRPYIHENTKPDCWIEYHRFDQDGKPLPEYSGTNCKETVERYKTQAKPNGVTTLTVEPQGSTAKTYYEFNPQDNNSKVNATIKVKVEDFHESISVRVEGNKAFVKGGNLGKNFPYDETEVEYPYANGYVTVPDGWIDGNGKYRGMGYQNAEGTALAQKKVAKINYASAMQSHLIGACNSYDDLHYLCVGASPLQAAYLEKGLARPVFAKHTEPYLMFWEEDGVVTYTGLCVYGAAKMDKVAFGYVKKIHPMYSMIEGSDNNLPLTDFRVPFDNEVIPVLKDGEMDGWSYNGETSFDYDAGATTDDDSDASPEIRKRWSIYHNFIYLNSTNIKVFDGTVEEFKQSDLATRDIASKYWCTTGNKAFHLLRYDFRPRANSEQAIGWVDAGLKDSSGEYSVVDLRTDLRTKDIYEQYKTSSAYDEINNAFKKCFADFFKEHGKFLMNQRSLLFCYCYVLSFLAGTDNSSKNTYYVIDPIKQDMSKDANTAFSDWYSATFGEIFDYTSCYLMYMAGDDMDSILPVNNMGNLTKPYYIERLYPYADGKTESLYEGMNNSLFNLVESAFTFDERSSMMYTIFSKMQELVSNDDNLLALKDNKQSIWGFLHKYFFNIQYYFPKIAYLEQARIRYEFAEVMGHRGARGVAPISQSIGSNVENEMQFMEQRVVYMASFAGFGSLGNKVGSIGLTDATDALDFRGSELPTGQPATFTFTLTPHQYIYPCGYFGETTVFSKQRTSPKDTCTITIASNVIGTPDASMGIRGINYYTYLGDFKDKSITGDLKIVGKRLKDCICNHIGTPLCRPNSLAINAKNIKIIISYFVTNGIVDLSNLTRLDECIISSTDYQISEFIFPKSNTLKSIYIHFAPAKIQLEDLPNLQNLSIWSPDSIVNLGSLYIGKNVGTNSTTPFNAQNIIQNIYNTQKTQKPQPRLQEISIQNVNFTNFDADVLEWYCGIPKCEFKGTISIKEDDKFGNPRITWDLKNKILKKFGNVDNVYHSNYKGLRLKYLERPFNPDGATIIGNYYPEQEGKTIQFAVKPSSIYENTQNHYIWGLVNGTSGTNIHYLTGLLTIGSLPTSEHITTIQLNVYYEGASGKYKTIYKPIKLWNRPAQLGDLVYYDGTYQDLDDYDGEKTPIGVCFYVAPRYTSGDKKGQIVEELFNPNDKQQRLMVALENVKYDNDYVYSAWGCNYPQGSSDLVKEETLYIDENNKTPLSIENIGLTQESFYDIESIVNLGGFFNDGSSTVTESTMRDTSSEISILNGGFIPYPSGNRISDGLSYQETLTQVRARTLNNSLSKLAGAGYNEGDIVNNGYANTLKIIEHRNKILNAGISVVGIPSLSAPNASGNISEMDSLMDLMTAITTWATNVRKDENPDKWKQIYYPAASICYAYEPKNLAIGEVLADKFKVHNWFLMPAGLASRIIWYNFVLGKDNDENIFKKAIDKKLFKSLAGHYFTSTENSLTGVTIMSDNLLVGYNKGDYYIMTRPICSF